ncbi:prepilin-type N-terminal cleavage/methylation domain-containing protein, partial [Patescibacteria group bacterium]|nr:prepilin-type N-terminal cleavage/methylation domain-containing protein [Patescibacteria group bacterium]
MLHIKNENSGFTLVELMMVIAIIGILAVIMFGVVRTAQQRAKDANIQAASANLTTALEGYYVLAGEYPDDLQKII